MKSTTLLFTILAPLSLATAKPLISDVNAAMILSIAPKSASCSPPQAPCMTAQDVAHTNITYIANAFGIFSNGEVAAALGTMAFESGEFKYNHNMFPAPGRPGQGTRNMQMASYNLQYALTLSQMDAGFKSASASLPKATSSDDPVAGEAALKLINTYPIADVGSALWFINHTCSPAIRQGLQAGTVGGWTAYVQSCIGTDPTEAGRQTYWETACKALGGCT